jgi:DUF4097 and DUF4098 domain-containing protein YvlB
MVGTGHRVRITVGSGRVEVTAEPRADVAVDRASVTVTEPDGGGPSETVVRGGSDSFTVRVPEGTDVVIGSSSGDVALDGSFGAVSVTTDSADVKIDRVASVDARSRSGRVDVEHSRGPVRMRSQSAKVRVGRAEGEARVATVSGTVTIGAAAGAVSAKTVSGAINVLVDGPGPVGVETVSGTITVELPTGARPHVRHRSISGKLKLDLERGDDLDVTTRTISGNVRVRAA